MGIEKSKKAELQPCSPCLQKYKRKQLSVCTCNHCSFSLCTDCMNDHIEEQPENVAKLFDQLHGLEQLTISNRTNHGCC